MNKLIDKLGKKITGEIKIPGDKSISIRAALISSFFYGDFEFKNFNFCKDTKTVLTCLKKLNDISATNKKQIITLDCENSATTMRLLTGMLCSLYEGSEITFKLIGDLSLTKRPMDRIVSPLKKMGACITCSKKGTAPIIINCKKCHMHDLKYESKISSAQVKSCLELAAFCAGKKLIYKEPIKSRDHTKIMLKYFSSLSEHHEKCHDKHCHCHDYVYYVPSDISIAAYYIANAIIYKNSNIQIKNVLVNPTRTGFIKNMIKAGIKINLKNQKILQDEKVADILIAYKHNQIINKLNISIKDVPTMIDEIPLLATLLSTANGKSIINGISELKVKESDRLLAITQILNILNVKYKIKNDSLTIYGDKDIDLSIIGETINSHKKILTAEQKKSLEKLLNSKDHRIILLLKLLNIKNIKNEKYLNVSIP